MHFIIIQNATFVVGVFLKFNVDPMTTTYSEIHSLTYSLGMKDRLSVKACLAWRCHFSIIPSIRIWNMLNVLLFCIEPIYGQVRHMFGSVQLF